jgi:hypothetical protein
MSQNIWEIVTVNDLVKILKEKEKKFVIVALTLKDTPIETVKLIKKFLKDYSKKYKNLTFLYYKVNDKDLGRISLLNKDKLEYPFVYHIYDINNIFVSVNRVNKNTLFESMNAVEEYYKKDLENKLYTTDIVNNNIEINNVGDENVLNCVDDAEYDNNMLPNDEESQRKVIEHQRMLNKIISFEERKKSHNIKFLEDIQKRKKEENKK